jgi:hypothetical protein
MLFLSKADGCRFDCLSEHLCCSLSGKIENFTPANSMEKGKSLKKYSDFAADGRHQSAIS